MTNAPPPGTPNDTTPQPNSEVPPEIPPKITPETAPEVIVETNEADDALLTGNERAFALMANILGIFSPIIAPLVIWMILKDDTPQACKDTFNFQIVFFGIAIILSFTCFGAILGLPLALATMVFLILAAISISKGEPYKFPWKYDFVK